MVRRSSWVVLLFFALVPGLALAFGQAAGSSSQSQKPSYAADPASLPIAISRVEKGDFALIDVEIIARWHAVQATPALETQFERSKDTNTKAKIANALLRLGEKDGPYWDFLADYARGVLQDVQPTPFDYDANGKAIGEPSKGFIEWAKDHHMSVGDAFNDAMAEAAGSIMDLGSSDDPRAIPILREALTSQNDFVKAEAARGLAELHDTESIPAIIKVCENAPSEAAALIAESLVYFDDPAAQRAVDEYVPKRTAQVLRDARAQGKTPYR